MMISRACRSKVIPSSWSVQQSSNHEQRVAAEEIILNFVTLSNLVGYWLTSLAISIRSSQAYQFYSTLDGMIGFHLVIQSKGCGHPRDGREKIPKKKTVIWSHFFVLNGVGWYLGDFWLLLGGDITRADEPNDSVAKGYLGGKSAPAVALRFKPKYFLLLYCIPDSISTIEHYFLNLTLGKTDIFYSVSKKCRLVRFRDSIWRKMMSFD